MIWYFKARKDYVTIQLLGHRLYEYSGLDDCAAVYVLGRAVAFKRFNKWEIGNLQRGIQ